MRIAVAMSGGKDSSAAALLLKEQGHDVLGFHMLLHEGSESSWEDARRVAEEIGLAVSRVDLREEFSELVIVPFVREYCRGRTPSPCPECNRNIKMTSLWRRALEMGCEYLATGHYARIVKSGKEWELRKGVDPKKDQSYFLFALTRDMLKRTLFPLGDFTKDAVAELLRRRNISVAEAQESQELCFVPDNDYRSFLKRAGVKERPGQIVDTEGKVLGEHRGTPWYTVGQRKGLGVSHSEPLYVIELDACANRLVVGARRETMVRRLTVSRMNLLVSEPPETGDEFLVRVRSTTREVPCRVVGSSAGELELRLSAPQSGVAPGQAAVFYREDRVLGGGWISRTERIAIQAER